MLPILHGLIESLSQFGDEQCQFKKVLIEEIKTRWLFDCENILLLGALADPQFKQLKFIDDDDHDIKDVVKEEVIRRMQPKNHGDSNNDEESASR